MKAGGAVALDAALPTIGGAAEPTVLNDASGLNPTPVFRHWVVKPDEQAELIARLRNELKAAAAERRPVCIGAARHSMGGQSLPRDGLAITVNSAHCEPDKSAKTFRADAGTRWHHVIAALDRIGFSPAVMQSNHDFGVAATFSVNAHGWPVPYGPFGSTVRSLRLMLADGTVVGCSRTENRDLFQLAMHVSLGRAAGAAERRPCRQHRGARRLQRRARRFPRPGRRRTLAHARSARREREHHGDFEVGCHAAKRHCTEAPFP